MSKQNILNTASLKDQVYDYLREEIRKRNLEPGSAVNMDATSKKLGISKTPLRDALIQLEMEGFVSILPRKGIYVKNLTLQEIKEYYQVIGALESEALRICFEKIKPVHIQKMKKLILEMKAAIGKNNFILFNRKNVAFHDIYIELSGNLWLKQIVNNLKKRLYDFVPHDQWIKEWEQSSIGEHQRLVDAVENGDLDAAARIIRDVHWNYDVQVRFIKRYYFDFGE